MNINPHNSSDRCNGFQLIFPHEISKWNEKIGRNIVPMGEIPISRELEIVPRSDNIAVFLQCSAGFVLRRGWRNISVDLARGCVDEGGVGGEEDGRLDRDAESLEEGFGSFVVDVGLCRIM